MMKENGNNSIAQRLAASGLRTASVDSEKLAWEVTSACSCASATVLKKVPQLPHLGGHENPESIATGILILLREMLVGLCSNPGSLISKGYLIQIWIAVGAGCTLLLAQDSLYDIDANEGALTSQQLQRYREESTKIQIPNDDMINRGFLQCEVAERCGIQGSKLVPVFSLDSPDSCVAVIELVTAAPDTEFGIKDFNEMKRGLEKVGLKTSNNVEYFFTARSSSAAQGLQEEPYSSVRSSRKGQEVQSNSDSQFYVGSCSSDDKTPIVSARLKDPRMIRIFRFKPLFTIEGLKREVRNQFKWDDNAGTKFDLHSVNKQNERVALMDRDEHVRELFGTHSVVFVMDVQLHEDARPSKRNKRGHGRDTRHGVELNINGDGYKMAYEAVARKLKPGKRDKMMQNIIDASPSKVKALRIKYCSPPSPPDLDGRHKKMRRGESSSSSTLEMQHYSGGPSNMISVQGKTKDILMSAETTTEQVQVQPVISVEQQVPRNYVVPPVSTSHMEEDPSNMELLVSKGKGRAEETAHGAVSASQMEGNECPADDLMVGFRVDDQLAFYDEKGREIDASGHDHDISSSVELNAPTVVVESIDPEQHVQPSELDSGIARNMEVISVQKSAGEETRHGAVRNYVVPLVSASQMEENVNPRNMELLVSAGKTQDIMSAETSEEQVQPTTELNYGIATNIDFDGNAVGDMELSISDFPLNTFGYLELLNADGDFSLPNDNFGWSGSGDNDDFDLTLHSMRSLKEFVLPNEDFGWCALGDFELPNGDFGCNAIDDLVLGFSLWD